MTVQILQGDCRDAMKTLPAGSVDSIVTDPPYELGFMGRQWDRTGVAFSTTTWEEALRVLKPGGYLLAFSGTRTYHRMVCAIEDAGFEIRDQIGWAFGSGFPKSHNGPWGGTALKPAWEPIVVARKPLIGTVEENWRQHGTGALNIDACRVPTDDKLGGGAEKATRPDQKGNEGWVRPWMSDEDAREAHAIRVHDNVLKAEMLGRWPANLIHDGSDEVLAAFPQAKGQQGPISGTAPSAKTSNVYGAMKREGEASADSDNLGAVGFKMKPGARRIDTGSAARFFYCAKANKADRNSGGAENNHPTVKPADLMRYLCRLVTPDGGLVLDPFMGSGSTLKAAELEGFDAIGIELSPDYIDIARRRIGADAPLFMEPA